MPPFVKPVKRILIFRIPDSPPSLLSTFCRSSKVDKGLFWVTGIVRTVVLTGIVPKVSRYSGMSEPSCLSFDRMPDSIR